MPPRIERTALRYYRPHTSTDTRYQYFRRHDFPLHFRARAFDARQCQASPPPLSDAAHFEARGLKRLAIDCAGRFRRGPRGDDQSLPDEGIAVLDRDGYVTRRPAGHGATRPPCRRCYYAGPKKTV